MEDKKTLEVIAQEWLQLKKISIKESSYYRYIYIIEQYIKPYFSDMEIKELEDYDFNVYILELMNHLKPITLKNVVGIFKSILNYARARYGYSFDFEFVTLPRIHTNELRVLSIKEKNKLEKYCLKKNTLRDIGILICLYTGLRVGEICALKWDCIDLENHCIKVKQTMQRIYNKKDKKSVIRIDRPKSQNSVRTIPIPNKLYNILKPLKKQYAKNCYFLTGDPHTYVEPRNYQSMFAKSVKDCKIKEFHFKSLSIENDQNISEVFSFHIISQ